MMNWGNDMTGEWWLGLLCGVLSGVTVTAVAVYFVLRAATMAAIGKSLW